MGVLLKTMAIGAMLATGQMAAAQAPSAPPPASARPVAAALTAHQFAQLPEFSNPVLSPDGKWVAARVLVGGKARIFLRNLAGGEAGRTISLPDKADLRFFRWAGSNRVLFSVGVVDLVYGVELHATRLFVYDVATRAIRFVGDRQQGLYGDDILWVDPEGKSVELAERQAIFDPLEVRRFDLDTGLATTLERPHDDEVFDWFADDAGNVRMAFLSDGDRWSIAYRRQPGDKLATIARGTDENFDQLNDAIRIVAGHDDGYILSADKTGRDALYKYDFKTRAVGDLVFESKTNDLDDFGLDDVTDAVRWVDYTDDRDRVVWFDPVMHDEQARIDRALPNTINRIVSTSRDKGTMLVESGGSDEPGTYYVYHVAARRMEALAAQNVGLDRERLSTTKPVSYKARDGLVIPAYLTLPKGRAAKGLPLIIMPHGGPYGVRDQLEYNPEVQFLAARGYAVLQPNYRGSASYGRDFDKAGDGQIGRRMQDDIDDGMDWLVAQGIVDPKRVCLEGGSYGGYAALWGATRNPERYRCAASFAGVTDFNRQLRYDQGFFDRKGARSWKARVRGDKGFDLATVSPMQQAARLQIPVLLGHGDADTNVPYTQSTSYAAALARLNKRYEFVTFKDEGHGFTRPDDYEIWLTRLGAFLDQYNPAT